ncbi:MAG TPA: DMT family transporter [Chloroflexota bacterium]|nr:DMT family transporter [Chloroflexota bacterium]
MSRYRGLAYVGAGVLFFSTSPALTRLAAPYSAFEITFGRMAVASLCVLALARATGVRLDYRREELGRLALYGLITALHFFLYVWSLDYTSIAHSLALVYTAPVFVTLFAAALLREPIDPRRYVGIPIVVLGVAVLAGMEPRLDARMALGDLLAVGSAVCFGLYSVAGRRERDRQPLLRYAGAVYGGAALWLLPPALLATHGWRGLGPTAAIAALGVFPLGIGHTLYNASLRRVHATYVNLIATQEVTGGILLGWLLLGEVPSTAAAIGAAITLVGVAVVLLGGAGQAAAAVEAPA